MTKEEILSMSESERINYLKELDKEIDKTYGEYNYYKAMQLALKLVINGTYGAFAHPQFSVSNKHIANAITRHGRDVILYMLSKIENYFYNNWHNDKEIHELLSTKYIAFNEDMSESYMIDINNNVILNKVYKTKDEEHNAFNELLKEWHINRNDLIEHKILNKEVNLKDKKIKVNILFLRKIHDFSNIDKIDGTIIGEREEMDGYKTFFHKDELIVYGDTDSLYFSYQPVMKSCNYNGDELEFIINIDRIFIKNVFTKWLDEYADKYKVKNIHDFELETINKSALHLEKKMYINNPVWEDGVFHENMTHFMPKGVDIVRSSTPPFVRGKKQIGGVWDFVRYLFANPGTQDVRQVMSILKELKKQFQLADIDQISMNTSLSNYRDKIIDDQNGVETVLGAHYSIKAAALHNYLLNKNSDLKTKYDLLSGGKVKWFFCKHPLNDRFAYMRSYFPSEIIDRENIIIDYDEQFNKTMLSIVNRFVKVVGLPEVNKRLSILNNLLGNNITTEKTLLQTNEENINFDAWDF